MNNSIFLMLQQPSERVLTVLTEPWAKVEKKDTYKNYFVSSDYHIRIKHTERPLQVRLWRVSNENNEKSMT